MLICLPLSNNLRHRCYCKDYFIDDMETCKIDMYMRTDRFNNLLQDTEIVPDIVIKFPFEQHFNYLKKTLI